MKELSIQDINNVMEIKQLPVIKQNLLSVKTTVETRMGQALHLGENGNVLKNLKASRAQIRKEFEYFEACRKTIKNGILQPYEAFETVYEECIASSYRHADMQLKNRISAVETHLRQTKYKELQTYFKEYAAGLGLDFITFEQAGLHINLSASVKSFKVRIRTFLDKIYEELQTIETQQYKEEILIEYKKHLNLSEAVKTVALRHKEIEKEKKKFHAQKQSATEQKIDLLNPPVIKDPFPHPDREDPVLELIFKIRAPRSKLKRLKQFLIEGGYEIESQTTTKRKAEIQHSHSDGQL